MGNGGGGAFFPPLQNIHAYQHRFFANRLMRYNAALAQKPAEIAFMYSNQALAHHAVASEQQVYCVCFHTGSVSCLTTLKAKFHTQVPTAVLLVTQAAANGAGSVFGI